MEESLGGSKRSHKACPRRSTSSRSRRKQGFRVRDPEEEGIEEECCMECTGQRCEECLATLMADCVALCCCPLSVISLLGLAFIKIPYVVGRRCIKRRRSKEKSKVVYQEVDIQVGIRDIVFEFRDGEMVDQRKSLCTGLVDLDNVFLEFYHLGHLGFGRVSFTGIHPNFMPI